MALTIPKVTLPRKVAGKSRAKTRVSGYAKGDELRLDNSPDLNKTSRNYRATYDVTQQLRDLYAVDGLVSTAILSLVRIANSGMTYQAYVTGTNEFSREGVQAAESLGASFDTLWDYTLGYSDKKSMKTLLQDLLLEAALSGGVGLELVLNSARMPMYLSQINYSTVTWTADGKGGRKPSQVSANSKTGRKETILLDYPTIWFAETAKGADQIYSSSIMVSSLKRLHHYDEFIEDMRRVIRQNGAPRLLVKLNHDKVRSSAPPGVQTDPDKLKAYMDSVQLAVEENIKNLNPEDSLVYFDLAEVDSVSTEGDKKDYKDMLDALSGLTASAMKSNPSILGLRLGGSQNTASTESMLFTHMAGVLQIPVEQVLSRAMTIAVRLLGVDCYVKAVFNPIDLRPQMELEGHKAIRQRRAMELLSSGRITDDEAQAMMGLGSLPADSPRLSGTFFYENSGDIIWEGARDNPNGRQIAPMTPASEGGRDNEQRV